MPTGVYKRSEAVKENLRIRNIGRKHSKETREKMSKPHTEETKRKISKGMIGKNTWLKGTKRSKKANEKTSKTLLGHIVNHETRKKISKSRIGIKFTKQHRKNISKGKTGSKYTDEHKKKIGEAQKGEKSHLWKGGITPQNDMIRASIEYRLWREAVFARDNWTCGKTKVKGGDLCAHHIQNFSKYPELRFAINNGITLSEKAHRKFHKKYGFTNNTKEQIEEFIN